MKAFRSKDLLPLATAIALLFFTGGLQAEVTDFPPQTRQPYEKGSKKSRTSPPAPARAPEGVPASAHMKKDASARDRGIRNAERLEIPVLGDKYWQAAYEYCRKHGGRLISGGRMCVM